MNRRELLKITATAGTLPWLASACTSEDYRVFASQYLTGNFAPVVWKVRCRTEGPTPM